MKTLSVLFVLLFASQSWAINNYGPDWKIEDQPNAIKEVKPGDGITNVDLDGRALKIYDLEISEDSNWNEQVAITTGVWGVPFRKFGITSCQIEKLDGENVIFKPCTTQRQGFEFDIDDEIEFPLPYDSTFFSVSSTTVILSDDFTTINELKTRVPVGRVQKTIEGGLSIMDLRFPVLEKDRHDYTYRRKMIGPAVSVDGGLIGLETGVRNIKIEGGTFSDERGQLHTIGSFSSLTGLTIWQNGPTFEDITAIRGLLKVDNLRYNDTTSGTLVEAQNNQKNLCMDLAISPAGGIVDGIDTGRGPTYFLFYCTDEFDSAADAKNAPVNLFKFEGATPRLLTLTRFILRKGRDAVEETFDLRIFITRPSGVSVAIQTTADMQLTYENSPNTGIPEIKTNDQNEALDILYEGITGDILRGFKNESTVTFGVSTSIINIKGQLIVEDSGKGIIQEWRDSAGRIVFTLTTGFPGVTVEEVIYEDQRTSGTAAGGCVLGSYLPRDFNAVIKSASFASLSSVNKIQINENGLYGFECSAPGFKVGAHKVIFENITDSLVIKQGTSEITNPVDGVTVKSWVRSTFEVDSAPELFQLKQQCSTTHAVNGFGFATGFGDNEVYATCRIWEE